MYSSSTLSLYYLLSFIKPILYPIISWSVSYCILVLYLYCVYYFYFLYLTTIYILQNNDKNIWIANYSSTPIVVISASSFLFCLIDSTYSFLFSIFRWAFSLLLSFWASVFPALPLGPQFASGL